MAHLGRLGIGVTRRSREFKFVWADDGWRAIYVLSPGACSPSDWLQCLAHELIHAAGYVRGTLPLPGARWYTYASTVPEEQTARDGAIMLCRRAGIEPNLSYLSELGELSDATELHARLGLITSTQ